MLDLHLRNFRAKICIFLTIAMLVFESGQAFADMRVLASNSPQYRVGEIVPDYSLEDLGPGCRVKVLKLPSNETELFEGPKVALPPVGGTREIPKPPCL